MELSNEFEVAAPIEQTWKVLTDLERIAPCLPGAQLQEVEGDEHRGVIKVKVGPITAQYKGKAVFVERDDAARRAVLQADGRDTRGQGNASATISAQLTATDAGTHVSVDTDLSVTGKVAQFGRGVMADVSSKLMAQFVENLETTVLADDPGYLNAARERGLARMKLEDFRGALEDFLLFLREDGNDPVANYNAALCLLTTDRRDLAVRYMERTVQSAPESDEARKARRFLGGEPGAAGRER